ncbi:tRNA nucleotidyltransferase/poly(A) polymerase [Stieleria maiorica]|uniref:tRNA nucleotidyltransferase/poly(A) polymerase n=1 Tax=Stieleria maiorica TaxID=2795974 RepID=A0A5B9MM33_9BACT|nr:CCA tRNA nucleotidyltransferase [Stieleria maiorica]QEF99927.1 tRNA nucleotidyltransferase/poly(A) polymerase [Stieleria maiorica]
MTKIGPLFDSASDHSRETQASLAEAIRICARLRERGHVAYFAGGCVRDALLGREPKDFDVATDATPDRVREIFGRRNTLAFGASFGVIGVLPEKRRDRSTESLDHVHPTEVATFRSDGEYSDGRRPDKVHYGDAKHDALRRDFTINGLFFDPAEEKVIDFVGGQVDLAARRLQTIGAADQRFEEDKLRMLRAVRFATTLGFELDPATKAEIVARAPEIAVVSAERIGAEMRRIVVSMHAPRGLELLIESGLDRLILPEIHFVDPACLVNHLGHRDALAFDSSMALILYLISENPAAPPLESLIDQITQRWRLSGEESRRITAATRRWPIIAGAHQRTWSQVQPTLVDRDADCVLQVAAAITCAEELPQAGVDLARKARSWPREQLDPQPLLTGDALRAAGYQPGPQFRSWLQAARDAQLDGQITTPEEALALVERLG